MERNMTAVRLNESKEKFSQNLIDRLDQLNKQHPVKLEPRGAEGPLVAFIQKDSVVFNLPVFYGKRQDHRVEFMMLAKEILLAHGFQVSQENY